MQAFAYFQVNEQRYHTSIRISIWCRCNRQDFWDTNQFAQSTCNSNASSNYMGSTVLLDVNSNTPGAPPVASALDCCLACIGNAQVPPHQKQQEKHLPA